MAFDLGKFVKDPLGSTKDLFSLDDELQDVAAPVNRLAKTGTGQPNRQDVISLILGEQLAKLNKNRNGLGGIGPSMEAEEEQVASTSLFGI